MPRVAVRNSALFAALLGMAAAIFISPASAQDVKYGTGNWEPESGLGNHRAVVRVSVFPEDGSAVLARVPWRRRDPSPETKAVIVVDAATGETISNSLALSVTRESGDIVFEPRTVPGDYYLYYLPYRSEGRRNYPNVKYTPPSRTASIEWLRANGLAEPAAAALKAGSFPRAEVVEIQAVDGFSSFDPMEVIATAAETEALLAASSGAPYLLFPEDRRHSIRMTDDLPRRWITTGPRDVFHGEAARGEYFTFQIGIWAARESLDNLSVHFTDLAPLYSSPAFGPAGAHTAIPALAVTCFNTEGLDWDGTPFQKTISVAKGKVQPLWCGIQVPADADPGPYTGLVTITPDGLPSSAVRLEITITSGLLADGGDSDPSRMTRLRWLNSTLAMDDDVVPPFEPMKVKGLTFRCLGRSLEVGSDGFPAAIRSYFNPAVTAVRSNGIDLIRAPIQLRIHDENKKELDWTPRAEGPGIIKQQPGAVAWETVNRAEGFTMTVDAEMELDGFVGYKIALKAERDITVSDIWLEIPVNPDCARYMMGLGFKGGERPETFSWAWDQTKNQDALWIGSVNAGMQVSWRAENYSRPLNTNFYLSKPLNLPPSWWNEGRGRISVRAESGAAANGKNGRANGRKNGETVYLRAHAGLRDIKAGETLHFDFNLLLTPFKLLDPAAHFSERYYHSYKPLDEVAATGANVLNIHHANEINPFINYPFLRPDRMKAYIDAAHARGFKVKIYNTIRELSNRAPELFALRSLGHEIFSSGPGGGYSWLQEHLVGDYIAAWFVPDLKDAAVINSGMSRWHNYYVEGLDWLSRNVGIDGLYIDDVAFDRTTMKRVRKVLERNRPGSLIDLHSANQYNPRDGYASSANLYLEHFPYLDRLWFGEYFDYDGSGPDYWLVEMSGIPFGLMGEMLQNGGNPWRGLVFGMTSRLPWAGDPRPLWRAWDEFGIVESEMLGWWADSNPVRTGNEDILATIYVKRPNKTEKKNGDKTKAMIALASWAGEAVDITFAIDWKALGLDPKAAVLTAPAIENFQPAAAFNPDDPIRVEPGKGWLLVLHER